MSWYGSEAALQASPFLTPYMQDMLTEVHSPHQGLEAVSLQEEPVRSFSIKGSHDFLQHLIERIERLEVPAEMSAEIKEQFVNQCAAKLEALNRVAEETTVAP